jgi:hypothetical protein
MPWSCAGRLPGSDDARDITGATLPIDGGWQARG